MTETSVIMIAGGRGSAAVPGLRGHQPDPMQRCPHRCKTLFRARLLVLYAAQRGLARDLRAALGEMVEVSNQKD